MILRTFHPLAFLFLLGRIKHLQLFMGQHQHQSHNRWSNVNLASTPTYRSPHSRHATWVKSFQSFEYLGELQKKTPFPLRTRLCRGLSVSLPCSARAVSHHTSKPLENNNLDIFSDKHRWVVKHPNMLSYSSEILTTLLSNSKPTSTFNCNQQAWAPLALANVILFNRKGSISMYMELCMIRIL